MTDTVWVVLAVPLGLALGLAYYGSLWLSLRRVTASSRPGLVFLGGLVLRLAIAAGGFYLLVLHGWAPPLLGLAGFMAARWIVKRRVGAAS